MLVDLTKRVWAAECHPKIRCWKFVLLNLCYHANPCCEAYPSVATMASESGYTTRAVIDALNGLERLGIIRRKGHCGQRQRTTVYDLTELSTNVHNLANGEVSSCLQLSNGEVTSKKTRFNGEVSSANGEVSSHRSILGRKEVSKLVSGGANGEMTSPLVDNSEKTSGKPTTGGHSAQREAIAPSARKEGDAATGDDKRRKLVKTPGWRPMTDGDRRHCMLHCMALGANRKEAEKFIRYNAVRRWTCCECGTVNDAAKEWIAKWRETCPDEFAAERERRKRISASKTLN